MSPDRPFPYPMDDPAVARPNPRAGRESVVISTTSGRIVEHLRRAIRYIPGVQAVFCALIMLAFATAPVGMAGWELPIGSAVHSGCERHQPPQDDTTGLRLCSMSACHPGVSVESVAMRWSKQRHVHEADIFTAASGVRPEIELPPPRSVV